MMNDRLRAALAASGLTYPDAGKHIGVDTKTIERWVSTGRVPHRQNRQSLATLLSVDERYLWPDVANRVAAQPQSELIALYPARCSVPPETWSRLLSEAREHIDVLAYAASFLFDSVPNFTQLITDAAGRGVQVRMMFGDPDCEAVRVRGEEEGIGDALAGRCRLTWRYVEPLTRLPGVDVAAHATTLYTTMVRADNDLLANIHQLGLPAGKAPVLHLRRITDDGLWTSYLKTFERVSQCARLGATVRP